MAFQCITTAVPGVRVMVPDVFRDPRGWFMETFRADRYRECGIDATFVQDNYSHSSRGILRGLHYQCRRPQVKLVMVVQGAIFDVAVDIRRGSPTFGRWVGQVLDDQNHRQLVIPAGFAHGFCVVSETADVVYKCSEYYDPTDDCGILWCDPQIGITWPVDRPQLSERDQHHPCLAEAGERLPAYPL